MSTDEVRERSEGRAKTGIVNLRAFDRGIVETLGATVQRVNNADNYFLRIGEIDSEDGRGAVEPPPGLPGVPVTFSFPEEVFEKYKIPMVLVRLDNLDPALQRWHPGLMQFRAPARGAQPVTHPLLGAAVQGWDRVVQRQQAVPFDLTYTIQVVGRERGASHTKLNRILDHVLWTFPPFCRVLVTDSVGDLRSYEAFMEGTSPLDDVAEIADRVVGFAVTVRVEGELDLTPEEYRATVTQPLRQQTTQR